MFGPALKVQIYFHESTRRETKYVCCIITLLIMKKINDNQDLESTIWTQQLLTCIKIVEKFVKFIIRCYYLIPILQYTHFWNVTDDISQRLLLTSSRKQCVQS